MEHESLPKVCSFNAIILKRRKLGKAANKAPCMKPSMSDCRDVPNGACCDYHRCEVFDGDSKRCRFVHTNTVNEVMKDFCSSHKSKHSMKKRKRADVLQRQERCVLTEVDRAVWGA